MGKFVMYNGGIESYYKCSDPSVLVKGQKYEVIKEKDRVWQTEYTLDGVVGSFNSVWFDEVVTYPKVILAMGKTVPTLGEKYELSMFSKNSEGIYKFTDVRTSPILEKRQIGEATYRIKTRNNIYIVEVNP